MLGRKQSLKGDLVLADYGPEESLNESADIEWVNKVKFKTFFSLHFVSNVFLLLLDLLSIFSYGYVD